MTWDIAWACAWPPLWAAVVCRMIPVLRPFTWPRFWGQWCNAGFWVMASEWWPGRDHPAAAVGAAQLVLGAVLWWRSRRRRRRAPRAYGAKSRALVAALVRKAREAARPRRVLRPAPGGA